MLKVKNTGYTFTSTNYSIKEQFNGKDVLTLTIPSDSEDAQHIAPDTILIENAHSNAEYTIKKINGDDDEIEVTAELNLDDFRAEIFKSYSKTGTPYAILIDVVPDGWTVDDLSGISSSSTVDLEAPTPEGVADSIVNIFGVVLRYNFETHTQTIYNPKTMQASGEYVTKELNLVSLSRYQDSSSLINRLYAYGKDGLTFSEINNGKPYVDNGVYLSDRVRCGYVSDDRFTDQQSLLDYATEQLASLARPTVSYECTPADIGATNTKYAFLQLRLMSVVTLLDTDTNTRADHQVVERTIWPYEPDKNELVLSTTTPTFTRDVINIEEQVKNELSNVAGEISDYVGELTEEILTASGGHVVINYGDDGKMAEILLMDTNDKATATNVIRMNQAGIAFSTSGYNGPFNGILTIDGKWYAEFIETWDLTASIIKAGILQTQDNGETFYLDLENGILKMKATSLSIGASSVATQDYVDEQDEAYKTLAVNESVQQAVEQAIIQLDEELEFYPTTSEMNSAIEYSVSNLSTEFNQTLTGYTTTQQMHNYVQGQTSGLLQDANDYTDDQLQSYPTTVQMNSAISQSATNITSSVEQTLTMYPTTNNMHSYVQGQTDSALEDAKDYTDSELQSYPTTVEMNSAISQSANNINLSLEQTLTYYPTTDNMESYVQGQTSDAVNDANDYTDQQVATRPTTTTVQNMIDISFDGITISSTSDGTGSVLTIKQGSTTLTSADIDFTGVFSVTQGIGVGGCATEIDAGVFRTLIAGSPLVTPSTPILTITPIYGSGSYYALLQFQAELNRSQIANLYLGDNNFNIVTEQAGLNIVTNNAVLWAPLVVHGDVNVEKLHGRVLEWRYLDSLQTYVLCGPRTELSS